MAPGAAWQTVVNGFDGQRSSTGWQQGTTPLTPGGLPQSANQMAFNFDKFFSHFDEAFKQPNAPFQQPKAPFDTSADCPAGAASTAHPTDASAPQSRPSLSFASNQAVHELSRSDIELAALEHAVNAVFQDLAARKIEKGIAKSHLAQIEARVQKLESNCVDNVQTSSLYQGKRR
eukprot:gnl/MRDRNA2_/MRDRNA2_85059_c1_seq1.p1 gnl/MRDRNA2_/MRDRNA2_85059_c1~~gnl/MRDRNA2_/MRDRNA2_85059_c1_seq1.p1  ORF type:complete len:190 (-),score=40.99 gnl/MRDRNA2_/MRDRNA2_85059_c1_seq1:448-972(-)